MKIAEIAGDLVAEQDALDKVVVGLSPEQWASLTPSPRWTVAHQIAHLTYFDHAAVVALNDPDGFSDLVAELWRATSEGDEAADELTLSDYLALGPEGLLTEWRQLRDHLAAAAAQLAEDARVAWFGPSMSGQSFLTARLMEVWAHGQDIFDAVGGQRPASDRIRHVAQLGYITRGWSFANRGEVPPAESVRLVLTAPSGDEWVWGPAEATESVSGTAVDFCLVVTQRRHLDDTSLVVVGPGALAWLSQAQAFAGPPTDGPQPSQTG